jgi:hypothetical protein
MQNFRMPISKNLEVGYSHGQPTVLEMETTPRESKAELVDLTTLHYSIAQMAVRRFQQLIDVDPLGYYIVSLNYAQGPCGSCDAEFFVNRDYPDSQIGISPGSLITMGQTGQPDSIGNVADGSWYSFSTTVQAESDLMELSLNIMCPTASDNTYFIDDVVITSQPIVANGDITSADFWKTQGPVGLNTTGYDDSSSWFMTCQDSSQALLWQPGILMTAGFTYTLTFYYLHWDWSNTDAADISPLLQVWLDGTLLAVIAPGSPLDSNGNRWSQGWIQVQETFVAPNAFESTDGTPFYTLIILVLCPGHGSAIAANVDSISIIVEQPQTQQGVSKRDLPNCPILGTENLIQNGDFSCLDSYGIPTPYWTQTEDVAIGGASGYSSNYPLLLTSDTSILLGCSDDDASGIQQVIDITLQAEHFLTFQYQVLQAGSSSLAVTLVDVTGLSYSSTRIAGGSPNGSPNSLGNDAVTWSTDFSVFTPSIGQVTMTFEVDCSGFPAEWLLDNIFVTPIAAGSEWYPDDTHGILS